MSAPAIAVVVASHDRPLRLRWLLNALEEQTLERERFEVVVAHDSAGPETEALLRDHPLASAGVLRHLSFPPGSAGPAAKRNAAWRAANAPLLAFTDDDCRPPQEWLANALAAAEREPGAIVQGATMPDPDEAVLLHAAPWARSQEIDPPVPWAQTCNIVYPREVLERLDGFDETLPLAAGEDTDLAVRAAHAGVPYVGAPEALTYHCVEPFTLPARVRGVWRWQHLAYLVKKHPELRRHLPLRLFWKPAHARLPLALAGGALALRRRNPRWALLVVPWAVVAAPRYGTGPRGLARSLSELPGQAVIDVAELLALVRGSIRHRTLFL